MLRILSLPQQHLVLGLTYFHTIGFRGHLAIKMIQS
jgi:hypothetical protein